MLSPTALYAAKWITVLKSYFSNTLRRASVSQVSTCSNATLRPRIFSTPSIAEASELEKLSMMTTS